MPTGTYISTLLKRRNKYETYRKHAPWFGDVLKSLLFKDY